MKKNGVIAMIVLLTFSLCACGRKTQPQVTEPMPTVPESTTMPTVIPEIDPTMDTNIPDPTVNGNSTADNNATDETNESDSNMTDSTGDGNMDQQESAARGSRLR